MKFGAHCLYPPRDCVLEALQLGVQSYSEMYPEFTLLTRLLSWMSATRGVVASVAFMTRVYKMLLNHMSNLSSPAAGMNAFTKLLREGSPILWLPADNEASPSLFVDGNMWSLSSIVSRDPTSKFNFECSPVKALNQYDVGHYADCMRTLFARKRVCTVCLAHEGMFGARGAPLQDRKIFAQTCTCVDEGFNKFVVDLPGLIRSSPSLADMLSLLRYYKNEFLSGNESELGSKTLLEDRNNRIAVDVKSTVVSISKEIWKCFNSSNCLHPYAPDALRTARHVFEKECLLMTLKGEFVRSQDSDMFAIVVDNISMFECFEDQISTESVCLIDGLSKGEVSLSNNHTCLDTLAEERRDFMELPPNEFFMKTGFIPPETFFAPNSSLPLMQFLEVPCLSQFVTETTSFADKSFDVTNTIQCMNALLRLIQMFLLKSEICSRVDQLAQSTRVRSLLDMKIYGCENLNYSLYLHIPQLGIKATEENLTHDFFYDSSENILLINHLCAYDVRKDLCIDLAMKAIKIEVALMQRNQCVEVMDPLFKVLKKYSRRQGWKVSEMGCTWQRTSSIVGVNVCYP